MKYKNKADQILMAVFLLFLLSVWLKHVYKDQFMIHLFYAVMEAALVGGVADWFAITALFKKPLGFPWHTALIPRHRGRVIASIRDMVHHELLTVESIKERVNHHSIVMLLIDFIDSSKGKELLKNWFTTSCQAMVRHLDRTDIMVQLQHYIENEIRDSHPTTHLKKLIVWLLEANRIQYVTIYIVEKIIEYIKQPEVKQDIYRYLEQFMQGKERPALEKIFIWLGEQTNSLSISDGVTAFYDEGVLLLQELENPDHEVHAWIAQKLTAFLDQSETDVFCLEDIEQWKLTVVATHGVGHTVEQIVNQFIQVTSPTSYVQFFDWVGSQIEQYWTFFRESHEIQSWLEVRIKQVIYEFIDKEHHVIGELVERVLNEFSNERLNQFVEQKAGDDLQWIRINGSVVGGFVGLVMFLFLHYFYDVYVVSMIQRWL